MQKIEVNLAGGLGNQIFQFAAGLNFANITEKRLILNLTNVARSHSKHNISSFQMNHELKDRWIIRRVGMVVPHMNTVRNKIRFSRQGHLLDNGYESNLSALMNRSIYAISGYFQDLRYLTAGCDLNLELKEPSKRYLEYFDRFHKNQNIGVHIRRGDFVGQSESHGCLSADWYYKEIIKELQSAPRDVKVFIFSDDFHWVDSNFASKLHLDIDWEIVSSLELADPAESWCLLRSVNHIICANSTFSLTAAALANGSVTVPCPLTRNDNFKAIGENIPEHWKKIDSIWELQ